MLLVLSLRGIRLRRMKKQSYKFMRSPRPPIRLGGIAMTFCLMLFLVSPVSAKPFSTYDLSLDFPIDGGVMIMGSKMWWIGKHVRGGFMVGGGTIERDFDLPGGVEGHTEAKIFPFFGPRLSFSWEVIGLSMGYGLLHADTEFEAKGGILPTTVRDEEKGWGSALYSPFIVLDFYDKKHDLVFGFGLGGFLGIDEPSFEARSGNNLVSSSPGAFSSLTLHVHTTWATNRKQRRKENQEDEFE